MSLRFTDTEEAGLACVLHRGTERAVEAMEALRAFMIGVAQIQCHLDKVDAEDVAQELLFQWWQLRDFWPAKPSAWVRGAVILRSALLLRGKMSARTAAVRFKEVLEGTGRDVTRMEAQVLLLVERWHVPSDVFSAKFMREDGSKWKEVGDFLGLSPDRIKYIVKVFDEKRGKDRADG